jgi:hypothetical protein
MDLSEIELQGQLHDARIARAQDASKAAGLPRQPKPIKVRVVEGVESLGAELQGHAFADL